MKTMEMRHTCPQTCEKHENSQKRSDSDEKVQKLWILLESATTDQAEQWSNESTEKRTRVRKKQTHRSFSGPPIFPKRGVISAFIKEKGETVIVEV